MASEDGARARGEGWAWMTMPVLLAPLDPAYGWGEATPDDLKAITPPWEEAEGASEALAPWDEETRSAVQKIIDGGDQTWHPYAEGIWLRTAQLRLFEEFYFCDADSYRLLGPRDSEALSTSDGKNDLAVFELSAGKAHVSRSGRVEETAGWRNFELFASSPPDQRAHVHSLPPPAG